jgi:SEC-C motif-containing protein
MFYCYCGYQIPFEKCCDLLISEQNIAVSPEQLMRSRYSAYCLQKMDYILKTTDPQTLQKIDHQGNATWAKTTKFFGLEILNTSEEGSKGHVEFKARYQVNDQPEQIHHEVSKFRKQSGKWYFREGKVKG